MVVDRYTQCNAKEHLFYVKWCMSLGYKEAALDSEHPVLSCSLGLINKKTTTTSSSTTMSPTLYLSLAITTTQLSCIDPKDYDHYPTVSPESILFASLATPFELEERI